MRRKIVTLPTLFGLALVSACTCISAEVRNEANQPVFVNKAYYSDGRLLEEEGVIVDAGDGTDFPIYHGDTFIRVRDLSGNTIRFEEVPDDADSKIQIAAIGPTVDSPNLGELATLAGNGPTAWSTTVCVGGDRKKVRLFGTTVTVRSKYNESLVVSVVEDWRRAREEQTVRGALLPPGGTAEAYGMIFERGWLRAVDPAGNLVYAEEIPKREASAVVVPSDPPASPSEIEAGKIRC